MSSISLARVLKVRPGADGLVRATTFRTASLIFDRPIAKLILLPILDHDVSADMLRRMEYSGANVEIKPSSEKAP